MATQVLADIFGIAHETQVSAERVNDNSSRWMAEQRARRGATPEVFFTRRLDNSRLVKVQCPVRRREMRAFAGAMAMLFALILFYGWQHYQSIQSGYRIESQKQQVAQLEEQNRELRLSEAQLSDPGRIDRLAHSMGLEQPAPGQLAVAGNPGGDGGAVMAEVRPLSSLR